MWIFTRWGFYSVACARQGDGGHENEIDPHNLIVAATLRSQLEAIQLHLPDLIGNCAIKEHADADFKYQMFVEKNIWSQVMLSLSQELNYDNFRDEMVKEHSMDDTQYLKQLTSVGNILLKPNKSEVSK